MKVEHMERICVFYFFALATSRNSSLPSIVLRAYNLRMRLLVLLMIVVKKGLEKKAGQESVCVF